MAVQTGLKLWGRPRATPQVAQPAGFDYGDPLASMRLFERAYPGARGLGEVDPSILEALRERNVRESGARQRGVLERLRGSAEGAQPGQYGVLAALSDIQGQSDLSRESGEAYLGEAGRARTYREREAEGAQDYFRNYQDRLMQFANQREADARQRQANEELARVQSGLLERKGRRAPRNPISVGFGPVKVGFARGGIVTRPTRALLGEEGPEAVIPLGDYFGAGGSYDPAERRWKSPREQMDDIRRSALGGRDLISSRLGMGRLGSMDLPGAAEDGDPSTLPLPPEPYREPGPVRPQGILERIGELSRMLQVELGPEAPGVLKALALGAGGVAAIGERRLKRREDERGRASTAVERLNKRQEQLYGKQLEVAGRAPVQMVQLPDGSYVPVRSTPGSLEVQRRNPSIRPPRAPRATPAPKGDAELGRFVSDTVSRLDRVKTEQEIDSIAQSVKGIRLSSSQLSRLKAAADAAYARVGNASPY